MQRALEQKYLLQHVDRISYALAVDIHSTSPPRSRSRSFEESEDGEDAIGDPLCLLADRSRVAQEYGGPHRFTFYPLAFHPRYGNFSSPRPPRFLHNLCTIMQDNMRLQNHGADVLSFGFFQGYSNIKRAIRSRPEDLLPTQGIATAALTLPPGEARQATRLQAQQQRLLSTLRGNATPEAPALSTPFARERQRIEAAIAQDQVAFRMEQVVTMRTSRLIARRASPISSSPSSS